MNIASAFIAGFFLGELFQLGAWKMGHPDRTLAGYFKESWGHWCINLAMVGLMGVLWYTELLGPLLGHLGFSPIAQLLSISPPFGFLLAFATDIMGDKLAFGLTAYLARKVPGGNVSRETIQGGESGEDLPEAEKP